jgi:putative acetyltransferase
MMFLRGYHWPASTRFATFRCCQDRSDFCHKIFAFDLPMITIRLAEFPQDSAAILDIWREFVANSPESLAYQKNDEEFSNLPGKYAQPAGRIILADFDGQLDGCVALKMVSSEICEMKRLYVRPHARGAGLGHKLVERVIHEARLAGYVDMRLDVMAKSEPARQLYKKHGFLTADPVSFNPVPGASFLGLRLN